MSSTCCIFFYVMTIYNFDHVQLCAAGIMLIKTRLGDVQKFVRITEPNLKEFLVAGKKSTLESTFVLQAFKCFE